MRNREYESETNLRSVKIRPAEGDECSDSNPMTDNGSCIDFVVQICFLAFQSFGKQIWQVLFFPLLNSFSSMLDACFSKWHSWTKRWPLAPGHFSVKSQLLLQTRMMTMSVEIESFTTFLDFKTWASIMDCLGELEYYRPLTSEPGSSDFYLVHVSNFGGWQVRRTSHMPPSLPPPPPWFSR